MGGDEVQEEEELRVGAGRGRPLRDPAPQHHEAQRHVSQERSGLGGLEAGAPTVCLQLADVVQQGSCEYQVGIGTTGLGDRPADRGHFAGVLQQPAQHGVVPRGARRTLAVAAAELRIIARLCENPKVSAVSPRS